MYQRNKTTNDDGQSAGFGPGWERHEASEYRPQEPFLLKRLISEMSEEQKERFETVLRKCQERDLHLIEPDHQVGPVAPGMAILHDADERVLGKVAGGDITEWVRLILQGTVSPDEFFELVDDILATTPKHRPTQPSIDVAAVGVDRVAARYDEETANGLRFTLVNGDVEPARPYATVEVFAKDGGFEFAFRATNGASDLEQRSVAFIGTSPARNLILMELVKLAFVSAPDPVKAVERMLLMQCGTPYPVQLQGKYEGTEAGGATIVISIWNAARTPSKRVATIRVDTVRKVNSVDIEDDANGTEQTAIFELQNPTVSKRVISPHLPSHQSGSASAS